MAISVYVADLSDYNAGKFTGFWADLDDYYDSDELHEAIQDFLTEQTNADQYGYLHEEYAIHDYNCGFDIDLSSEYPNFDELFKINELLNEYGDAFAAYYSNGYINDYDRWEDDFNNRYQGEMTMEEYTEHLVDDGCFGDIAESIKCYINYEAIARDLKCEYTEINGFIFSDY